MSPTRPLPLQWDDQVYTTALNGCNASFSLSHYYTSTRAKRHQQSPFRELAAARTYHAPGVKRIRLDDLAHLLDALALEDQQRAELLFLRIRRSEVRARAEDGTAGLCVRAPQLLVRVLEAKRRCGYVLMAPVATWGLRLAMCATWVAFHRSSMSGAVEYGAHSTN